MSDELLFKGVIGSFVSNGNTVAMLQKWLAEYESQKSQVTDLFSSAENAVMALYPQFKNDYQKLIANGYMAKDGDYLKWQKSKQCLAEYFKNICRGDKKMSWKEIHTLFKESTLSQSLSRNGNAYKSESKDYENLKKILKS